MGTGWRNRPAALLAAVSTQNSVTGGASRGKPSVDGPALLPSRVASRRGASAQCCGWAASSLPSGFPIGAEDLRRVRCLPTPSGCCATGPGCSGGVVEKQRSTGLKGRTYECAVSNASLAQGSPLCSQRRGGQVHRPMPRPWLVLRRGPPGGTAAVPCTDSSTRMAFLFRIFRFETPERPQEIVGCRRCAPVSNPEQRGVAKTRRAGTRPFLTRLRRSASAVLQDMAAA